MIAIRHASAILLPPLAGEVARRAEGGIVEPSDKGPTFEGAITPSARFADTSPVNGGGMNGASGG
jgi:hypothetical protein